eukprot:7351184-Prymnesium_polylepis.1
MVTVKKESAPSNWEHTSAGWVATQVIGGASIIPLLKPTARSSNQLVPVAFSMRSLLTAQQTFFNLLHRSAAPFDVEHVSHVRQRIRFLNWMDHSGRVVI